MLSHYFTYFGGLRSGFLRFGVRGFEAGVVLGLQGLGA